MSQESDDDVVIAYKRRSGFQLVNNSRSQAMVFSPCQGVSMTDRGIKREGTLKFAALEIPTDNFSLDLKTSISEFEKSIRNSEEQTNSAFATPRKILSSYDHSVCERKQKFAQTSSKQDSDLSMRSRTGLWRGTGKPYYRTMTPLTQGRNVFKTPLRNENTSSDQFLDEESEFFKQELSFRTPEFHSKRGKGESSRYCRQSQSSKMSKFLQGFSEERRRKITNLSTGEVAAPEFAHAHEKTSLDDEASLVKIGCLFGEETIENDQVNDEIQEIDSFSESNSSPVRCDQSFTDEKSFLSPERPEFIPHNLVDDWVTLGNSGKKGKLRTRLDRLHALRHFKVQQEAKNREISTIKPEKYRVIAQLDRYDSLFVYLCTKFASSDLKASPTSSLENVEIWVRNIHLSVSTEFYVRRFGGIFWHLPSGKSVLLLLSPRAIRLK